MVISRVLSNGLKIITPPVITDNIPTGSIIVLVNPALLFLKNENTNISPMTKAQIPIIVTKTVATSSGLDNIKTPINNPIIPSGNKKYHCGLFFFNRTAPVTSAMPPKRMVIAK
jgi:hypothetical protein